MQRAYDFLKGHTYFIATEDGDQARVRPFGSLFLHEGKLYISTTNDKKVYEQMKKQPKIEMAAMGQGGWIRITAEVVEEKDPEIIKLIWKDTAERRHLDPEKMNPNTASFYLQNGTVAIIRGQETETFSF